MSKATITLAEAIARTGSTAAVLLSHFPESSIHLDEATVSEWIKEVQELRETHRERNLAILEKLEQRVQQEESK